MRKKKVWVMARLTAKTAAGLRELGNLWQSQWYKGDMTVPAPSDRWGYSIDYVVQQLLERDNDHRLRAKRARSVLSEKTAEADASSAKDSGGHDEDNEQT